MSRDAQATTGRGDGAACNVTKKSWGTVTGEAGRDRGCRRVHHQPLLNIALCSIEKTSSDGSRAGRRVRTTIIGESIGLALDLQTARARDWRSSNVDRGGRGGDDTCDGRGKGYGGGLGRSLDFKEARAKGRSRWVSLEQYDSKVQRRT